MKNRREDEIKLVHLADFVGYAEHVMCSSPSNIAVKWYFEWVLNATFNL